MHHRSLTLLSRAALLGWLAVAPSQAWAVEAKSTEKQSENQPADTGEGLSGAFLSGRFAGMSGDRPSAIRYLEQALAEDPKNDTLAGQLLVLYLNAGQMDKAIRQAEMLKDVPGHELLVDLMLIVGHTQQERYAAADAQLEKSFTREKASIWLPLFRAWVQLGEGLMRKPLLPGDIQADLQKVPTFLTYQLALINDMAGFTDVARQQYEQATADHEKAPYRAVEALADFYRRNGETAKLAQLKTDYITTRPTLGTMLSEEQGMSGGALLDQTLAQGGAQNRRLVGNPQEGMAEVLFTMASVLYSVDAAADTQLYLRMALYLRPDFPLAQLLLANTLENSSDYGESARLYGSISKQSPLYERALLRQAFMIEKQGHLDEASAMLDALAQQDKTAHEPYVAKGDLLRSRGRFKEAAAAYTQALERIREPQSYHWGIYFARGASYERAGEWDLAEKDLRQALTLSPDQPEALNYLGYGMLTRDEDVDEAAKFIGRAYALAPSAPHIMDSMGWALYKSGSLHEAIDLLEQAIDQTPGEPSVNDHLGDAYWQAGRKTEARYQWERSLSFSPDPQTAAQIRRKLKDGLPPLEAKAPDKPEASALAHAAPPQPAADGALEEQPE
jgi:tetratricopeptide (TPR) repeat protein